MESPPSIETVYEVLQGLYSPNSEGKEQASTWLGLLQKSVYAWKISDELLHRKNDVESCYFAAQTMRAKVQGAFHELPTESHMALRDSLILHLQCVSEQTFPAIITQLSLALADFALQCTEWEDPLSDLLAKLGNDNHLSLLEVLTVLPEEVASPQLRLGANRREKMITYLAQHSHPVVQILNSCVIDEAHPVIQQRAIRCLGAWFTVPDIKTDHIAKLPLLPYMFNSLTSQQTSSKLHEIATDCMCNALFIIEDPQKHAILASVLCMNIINMKAAYLSTVSNEDAERSLNFCRLFTELAESLLPTMLKSSNNQIPVGEILDILLTCVSHPDYEVAQVTFSFWYRLSDDVYQMTNEMYKEGECDQLTPSFKPYIQRLLFALQKQIQMDPDHEGVLTDTEEFWEFRQRVCELIKDVVFIPSSTECLNAVCSLLFSGGHVTWESSEAALFILQAIAKNLMPEENVMLPKIMEAVLSLAETIHVQVKYTVLQMMGELSEWLEKHPTFLEPVLNFIVQGLKNDCLATVASTALQSVCTHCPQQMGAHFGGLLQIVESLDGLNISNDAAIGLLKGTASVFEHLPQADIPDALKRLCYIQLNPLSELLKSGVDVKKGGKQDPALWLDRLAAIFRHISIPVRNGDAHPCQAVFTEMVWSVVAGVCERYQRDPRIVERYCRCIRFAIRSMGRHATPVLQPLIEQMVNMYTLHGHSCFLYLGSILVDEFAKEQAYVEPLLGMLAAFLPPTVNMLHQTDGMRNHPDTIDDLFRLCHRFLQRAPIQFLSCEGAPLVVQIAVEACTLEQRDAHSSVLKFLTDLAQIANSKEGNNESRELVLKVLHGTGQQLICKLISSVAAGLPMFLIPDISEFLIELVQLDNRMLAQWMEVAITGLPINVMGRETATSQQLQSFYQSVTNAKMIKQVTNALRELSRLYR